MLDILENTIFDEMDFYTQDIKTLMLWLKDALSQSRFSSKWKSLVAYQHMISAKEQAATERTLGGYFFSNGGFDNMEQYSQYVKAVNVFKSQYSTARGYSKVVPPVAISNIVVDGEDLSQPIERYRSQIQYGNIDNPSILLAFDWFDKMSLYIDHLFAIQKQIEDAIVRGIGELANNKIIPILWFSIVICVSINYGPK